MAEAEQDEQPPPKRQKTTDKSESDSETEPEQIRIREPDVGITEYISAYPPIQGILKQRYSDFLVNELDEKGTILRLNDISEDTDDEEPTELIDTSVLPEECQAELKKIAESHDAENNVLIEVGEDKELRTSIHKAIRALNLPLESFTEEDDSGQKVIRVTKARVAFGQKYAPPNRWPATRPNYCHFLLYKENKDTPYALEMIAKALHVRTALFSYAGTKDKRAKTVQKVSAYRIPKAKLLKLNKWWRREIMLGNCSYQKELLRLGDQGGNHFTIVLRDVIGPDDLITNALKSLQDIGFINYFGMQRFGTGQTPTHEIGKALLKSNWSEAIDLILMSNPGVSKHHNTETWRDVWAETKDPGKTLDAMGRRHGVEKQLLEGIRRFGPTDYINSLDTIPRNTRTMYVHSYQSYIWNTVASSRLRRHGLKPVIGDLVLTETVGRHERKERVPTKFITEENIHNYTIYDVVIPLPGYDVDFPQNDMKALYVELMDKDGLRMEDLRHRVKNYSLPGAYRHLVVKPRDVTWRILRYDDVTIPLALSDADRLQGMAEPESIEGGKWKALILNLSLPPSTYATMAVREVLKGDTSSSHQASLNTKLKADDLAKNDVGKNGVTNNDVKETN